MQSYYSDIYNYGTKFSNDSSLVADCIQEVFISLWQRRESATTILSLKYYLLRAVKNKVLKALHTKRRSHQADLESGYDFFQEFSIERQIIEKQISEEKAQRLRQVLGLLSKKQQEIIYLKYYQHLDYGQIADLMSINRQSVYNLLHETIQRLRTVWQIEFVTPRHR